MKKIRRVLDSITFRLALVYTLVFGASVAGLFYFVYWATAGFAIQQAEAAVEADVSGFVDSYGPSYCIVCLVNSVRRRSDQNSTNREGIYLLVNSMGTPIAGNLQSWPSQMEAQDLWLKFTVNDLRTATPETADVRAKQFLLADGFRLLVGRDVRSVNQLRARLLGSINIGIGITLALGIIGGFIFSRVVVRRIESITRTCRRIMSGDLTQRVPVAKRQDELGELSSNINDMLDQIERLMRGMQQVSDNIAHDLRTPLTRLRSRLESLLRHLKDPAERETIEDALADAESLLSTFAALLRIARAEAGVQGSFIDLNLHAIAEDVADLYGPLAEEKGLSFVTELDSHLTARGDPNLVAQALANVVDNAIKYTPQGTVTLALTEVGGRAAFVVSDTGPGIPDEFKPKVLERLFRMEQSRTSAGSGLGLSLAAAVARSHNIELKLEDNRPGLRVVLRFPQPQLKQDTAKPGADKTLAGKAPKALPAPDHSPHDSGKDKPSPAEAA
ncbi:MAG: sensor histidine kinase [Rhodospirillaceae bacterium]